jgi:flagellar M-ring protein FliF
MAGPVLSEGIVNSLLDVLGRLRDSLAALGARRLIALGLTGFVVFLLVGISGYMLSRPHQEVLYSSLDPQDVTRMGAALQDAGISFDVNTAGDALMVEYGQAAKARMLLAEKGLPRSDTSGYELFDKLGSLGLTTFMQQVTRVRALEGELARSIRLIDGIRAARVHLALRNDGSFRRDSEQATASVTIRADGDAGERSASAIRHLVAGAIPGLSANDVTIMSADGRLLASTDDPVSAAPEKLMGLERSISDDIEAKIARTLIPYVGMGNYTISVSTKLNADRRQTSETTFDPNSRVERSIRTVKESGEAQNAQSSGGVTAEQNIPVEQATSPSGDKSSEKKDRKEELTNYEINSRSVSTTSDGYGIDRLSVAVVVNKAVLVKDLGASPSPDDVKTRIAELQTLLTSASGVTADRGDTITVIAVDFLAAESQLPAESGQISEWLSAHAASLLNAGALLLVTMLVLLLGLRPALRLIMSERMASSTVSTPSLPGMVDPAGMPLADMSSGSAALDSFALPQIGEQDTDPLFDSLAREVANSPKDRLAKIVELDPERAAEVLKQWLREPNGQAA